MLKVINLLREKLDTCCIRDLVNGKFAVQRAELSRVADSIPDFNTPFILPWGGSKELIIMWPRDCPDYSSVCIFDLLLQFKLKLLSLPLVNHYLTVSSSCQQVLITLWKFHLDNCEVVFAIQLARWNRLLISSLAVWWSLYLPDNNSCELSFLCFASTCCHVTFIRSCQAEYFESMPVQFLGFRPECLAHKHIFNRWLSQMLPDIRVIHRPSIGENGGRVHILVRIKCLGIQIRIAKIGNTEWVVPNYRCLHF